MKKYPFPETEAKVTACRADVYRFRWPDYSSWAHFTICEATGEFSIQSDWCNLSYRWNMSGIGNYDSLAQFISLCDPAYIMRKFMYTKQEDTKPVFDPKATRELWEELIEEAWEYTASTTKDSREKWEKPIREAIEEFLDMVDDISMEYAIVEMPEALSKVIVEPYDQLVYRDSTYVAICQDELLPRFQRYLKDHVVPPESTPTV